MCGSEAKITDNPEVILGLSPTTLPGTHREKGAPADLGVASLVTPVLAVGISWVIATQYHSNQSFDFTPLLWILGLLAVASITGTILSICSLWKLERWPLLAVIGLMVNGGFLMNGLQLIIRGH